MIILTHCCYSKQLNQIFTNLHAQLNASTERSSATSTNIAEPEVTLSVLLSWLVWEVPHTTMSLTLRTITPELIKTLDTLYARKDVSVKHGTAPLINSLLLHLPDAYIDTPMVHAFLNRHPTATALPTVTPCEDSIFMTSDRPRRDIPINIDVHGKIPQTILTKMHTLIFKVTQV